MYISKITLTNFKSFSGKHELNLNKGINFFIGNNNCGKTTIFHAIEFILSGKDKKDFITKGKEEENVSVEVEFTGTDIKDIILAENSKLKKYQNYIIKNNDGTYSLRILRSSECTYITQNKKQVELGIKNIRFFNPNSEETDIKKYENPTGIDTTITALFDPQYVYSDLKNDDYQDFGKTKIIGKIINDIAKEFLKEVDENENKTVWGEFKEAYSKAFGEYGLSSILNSIEKLLTEKLNDQYGVTNVKFDFPCPDIDNFIKNGNLLLSDNGIYTEVSEKGTGMQRALAISLIQVYADIINKSKGISEKPIIFFIDEPETFMHPKAQDKLLSSFNKLSEKYQILITTHSPYLLKLFDATKHKLVLFYKNNSYSSFDYKEMLNIKSKKYPSWGEINYFAFDLASIEFHNELYGFLQNKATKENDKNYNEKDFDNWLLNKFNINNKKEYRKLNKDGNYTTKERTLPTFIRNVIHHPENTENSYTEEELKESISKLIEIIKTNYN